MAVTKMGGLTSVAAAQTIRREVELTSAQILALHTTPIEVIPAPGPGQVVVLDYIVARKPTGTAYGGIASSEDLEFRYTNASGHEIMDIETSGFLDQGSTERRVAGVSEGDYEPVTNAAVVVRLSGAITTGNTSVFLDVYYRVVREPS